MRLFVRYTLYETIIQNTLDIWKDKNAKYSELHQPGAFENLVVNV